MVLSLTTSNYIISAFIKKKTKKTNNCECVWVCLGQLPVPGPSCVSLLCTTIILFPVAHSPLTCSPPEIQNSNLTDGRLLLRFIQRPAPHRPGLWIAHPAHVSSHAARACEHTADVLGPFRGSRAADRKREREREREKEEGREREGRHHTAKSGLSFEVSWGRVWKTLLWLNQTCGAAPPAVMMLSRDSVDKLLHINNALSHEAHSIVQVMCAKWEVKAWNWAVCGAEHVQI